MGVAGLWKIVNDDLKPIRLEVLEDKRLAIDASIWIHQFVKAMRDKSGIEIENGHISGFFKRICKLLHYGILPIFVFDGAPPKIKKNTMAQRRSRQNDQERRIKIAAGKLLSSKLKSHLLKDVIQSSIADKNNDFDGKSPEASKTIIKKLTPNSGSKRTRDEYELPGVDLNQEHGSIIGQIKGNSPDIRMPTLEEAEASNFWGKIISDRKTISGYETGIFDFDGDDSNLQSSSNQSNLDRLNKSSEIDNILKSIDIDSSEFLELPHDIQYGILKELKDHSRQTSFKRLKSMVENSKTAMDFSQMQLENLMKRNKFMQGYMGVSGAKHRIMSTKSVDGVKVSSVASQRDVQYILIRSEGPTGGWKLGAPNAKSNEVDFNESSPSNNNNRIDLTHYSDDESKSDKIFDFLSPSLKKGRNYQQHSKLLNPDSSVSKNVNSYTKDNIVSTTQDSNSMTISSSDSDDFEDVKLPLDSQEILSSNEDNNISTFSNTPSKMPIFKIPQSRKPEIKSISPKNSQSSQNDSPTIMTNKAKPHDSFFGPSSSDSDDSDIDSGSMNSFFFDDLMAEKSSENTPENIIPISKSIESSTEKTGKLNLMKKLINNTYLIPKKNNIITASLCESGSIFEESDDEEDTENIVENYTTKEPTPSIPDSKLIQSNSNTIKINPAIDLDIRSETKSEPPSIEKLPATLSINKLKTLPNATAQNIDDTLDSSTIFVTSQPHEVIKNEKLLLNGIDQFKYDEDKTLGNINIVNPDEIKQENSINILKPKILHTLLSSNVIDLSLDSPNPNIGEPIGANSNNSILHSKLKTSIDIKPSESILETEAESEQNTISLANSSACNNIPEKNSDDSNISKIEDFKPVKLENREALTPNGLLESKESQAKRGAASGDHKNKVVTPSSKTLSEIRSVNSNPNSIIKTPNSNPGDNYTPSKKYVFSPFSPSSVDSLLSENSIEKKDFLFPSRPNNSISDVSPSTSLMSKFKSVHGDLSKQIEENNRTLYQARRDAAVSITDTILDDIRTLLGIFKIPYITAPEEAESSCAILEIKGHVDGVVTDDSDVLLFGAKNVYRNFFNQEKTVMKYEYNGFSRTRLIFYSYFLGSDYTIGVNGIGPTTVSVIYSYFGTFRDAFRMSDKKVTNIGKVEIPDKFKSLDLDKVLFSDDPDENETKSELLVTLLSHFYKFSKMSKESNLVVYKGAPKTLAKLAALANKIEFPPGFPDIKISQAYYNPSVIEVKQKKTFSGNFFKNRNLSKDSECLNATATGDQQVLENFEWGVPDLDLIQTYMFEKVDMGLEKVEKAVLPIVKKIIDRKQGANGMSKTNTKLFNKNMGKQSFLGNSSFKINNSLYGSSQNSSANSSRADRNGPFSQNSENIGDNPKSKNNTPSWFL
ncbi:DNA repair protein rad13 [Smittium culicis]|uniref:DNA repair protein rad13 n=1 Tax=Smittium culicis TaxID=133412 RepID=A0A1R1XVC9_9FUNG|nr:DNA repair protein rad13 [Smittium culicis]OMJ27245.1 DNA repair protein rad13 [Smittium culicis]